MPPITALGIFAALALLADLIIRKNSPKSSPATLIPLAWILIAGSRPITTWFDRSGINSPETLLEGSPLDRAIYQGLIGAAVLVLLNRKFSFVDAARRNSVLAAYFAFLLLGSLWSDYSFLASKRWIKDFGNVLVVLVLVTEKDPLGAARTVMLRCASLLIPASILLIKYFPEYGRYHEAYTGRAHYSGVALDKNLLGMTVTALLAFVLWALLEQRESSSRRSNAKFQILCLGLLAMGAWLLQLADCATAVATCLAGLLLFGILRVRFVRRHPVLAAGIGGVAAAAAVWAGLTNEIENWAASHLERDASLTGRDEIWRIVLAEDVNPWFGAGSYTFWMPERMDRMAHGYLVAFNSAHNGFIDIYLNVGLIGAGLLVFMLVAGLARMSLHLNTAPFQWSACTGIVFLAVSAVYAVTEAVFNRLNLLWIGVLIFVLCFRVDGMQSTSRPQLVAGRLVT